MCPCCGLQEENHEHMLQCKDNPEKWELARELLVPIFKKHKLDPIIRILLSEYIINPDARVHEVFRQHHIIDFKPYLQVIRERKQIGWKQLRYARWTKGWAEIQYRYENQTTGNATHPTTFPKWISAIIQELWKFQRTRWKARNNRTHRESTYSHTKQNLFIRIRGIYAKQDLLRQQDQFPFNRSLEEWKEQTTTKMSKWIKQNVPFIKFCLKVSQAQRKKGSTDIRKYFSSGAESTKIAKNTIKVRKSRNRPVKCRKLDEFGFTTKKEPPLKKYKT